jgi:hypothetical protein
MSFQAYLDAIEEKTGKTPKELIAIAKTKKFNKDTKAGDILTWLKNDYSLGRGHGMAFVHVMKHGSKISEKHVNSGKTHSDSSSTLNLSGKKKK